MNQTDKSLKKISRATRIFRRSVQRVYSKLDLQ